MKNLTEEYECIIKAQRDAKQFEPLYDKHYVSIWKFIYSRVEDKKDVADLVSNVFASALFNIKKYIPMGYPFSCWLYKIANNEINRYYQLSNKTRLVSIESSGVKQMAAETGKEFSEFNQVLAVALKYLNLAEMELIQLRFFDDKSFAEIANILDITENNAKVKTYRVLDKLKLAFTNVNN
jgi:RNA polymerase sigma-70 factor (ECF subfamily)